jgi:hypothetical protein
LPSLKASSTKSQETSKAQIKTLPNKQTEKSKHAQEDTAVLNEIGLSDGDGELKIRDFVKLLTLFF